MSSHLDTEHKELHLSASYIASLDERFGGNSREIEHEIKGVLLHELVHVFQYDAKGTIPGGLMEGIADWVRLKGGLGAGHWQEDPRGRDWDAGYEVSCPDLSQGLDMRVESLLFLLSDHSLLPRVP